MSAATAPHWNRDGSHASGLGSGGKHRGFWARVAKRPDGCWVWLGYLDKDGAGKYCTRESGKQVTVRAAVYAWRELVGPVKDGHCLLAVVCWNRRCVNPVHRMEIPHRDIVRWICALSRPIDRADNRGEMSGKAILTKEDVLFIRGQKSEYGLNPALAMLFGVSPVTISKIRCRQGWKHLSGRQGRHERMTVREIRALLESRDRKPISVDELAQQRREDAA